MTRAAMSKELLNSKEMRRTAPRSRFSPKVAAQMRLEERDEQILQDLFLHRLMSRGQIERSYFSSTPRCNARLRLLFDHHFVVRHFPPYAPFGAQAIYSVGKAALPIVAQRLEMDLDEVRRFYRRSQTPAFIEHTLAVVDLWIALREAMDAVPGTSLELWLAEMQCRHEWEIRASGEKWRKEAFKPDAFFRLARSSDGALHDFFIECDLGHTSTKQFIGKLRMYSRYQESGLFEQTYGCSSFQTLVITTGKRRLENLKTVAAEQNVSLFWFTTFDLVKETSFLGRVWSQPGGKDFIHLLSS
jgi:hypothetical protein